MHYFNMAVDVTRKILHILVDILWMISHHREYIFNITRQYIQQQQKYTVCLYLVHVSSISSANITFKSWNILSVKKYF